MRGRRLSLGEETFVGLCQTVTEEFTQFGRSVAV
jgi:hypothetical protein